MSVGDYQVQLPTVPWSQAFQGLPCTSDLASGEGNIEGIPIIPSNVIVPLESIRGVGKMDDEMRQEKEKLYQPLSHSELVQHCITLSLALDKANVLLSTKVTHYGPAIPNKKKKREGRLGLA